MPRRLTRRNLTVMTTDGDEKNVEEPEHERKGSYAESREKQAEFEELVREEGDWQKAVDDVEDGQAPRAPRERSAAQHRDVTGARGPAAETGRRDAPGRLRSRGCGAPPAPSR